MYVFVIINNDILIFVAKNIFPSSIYIIKIMII